MLAIFLSTLSPLLVMFLCAAAGFILKNRSLLPDNADTVMSKLENYIFAPALIIHSFMNYCTVDSLRQYSSLVLYSLLALAVAMLIGIPLSYVFVRRPTYERGIYQYALVFANFGFMGNAIVPAILGAADPAILYKYMLFTLPLNTAVYTWGVMVLIPRGEQRSNPLKKLINPIFISILIGMLLGLTGLTDKIPAFLVTTLDYCKSCMAPVAMLLTGFTIGKFSFKQLLTDKKVWVASLLRLAVIPTIILGILMLTKANDLILTLALFAYAAPCGMNTIIFPTAYGGDPRPGASMTLISQVLCTLSIPLLFALLNTILA